MFRRGKGGQPTSPSASGDQQNDDEDVSLAPSVSSARIRQLEDEISVDRLLHSMSPGGSSKASEDVDPLDDVVPETSAAIAARAAAAASGAAAATSTSPGDMMDDMSAMTGDGSIRSRISQTSASVGAVLSQSLALLRGENPLLEGQSESDEDSSNGDGRPTSPINSLTMPTIPSERPFQDEEGAGAGRRLSSLQRRTSGARRISDTGSVETIDFLQDDPKDMTYGRIFALKMMRKKWYNPHADEEEEEGKEGEENEEHEQNGGADNNGALAAEDALRASSIIAPPPAKLSPRGKMDSSIVETHKPCLEKAWAYFEHVTLPRYIFTPKDPNAEKKGLLTRIFRKLFMKGDKKMDRAEPGEDEYQTRLYSPIFTPLNQMGDFGLGIGLYFSTLRAVTVMTILAGIINIPNFIYYNGEGYSDGQPGISRMLQGSAICTRNEWVPCPTCTPDQFSSDPFRFAYANVTNATTGNATDQIFFSLKNMCADGATFTQGMVNYGTLLFVIVSVLLMNLYQRKKEIEFDEDEQTAQDYSVQIANPPGNATDPLEWKNFFEEMFDDVRVTVCTVGLSNDLLVRSLVERREVLAKLRMRLPPGTSMDVLNLARIAGEEESKRRALGYLLALVAPGTPELFGRLAVLNAKIQGLAQQNYPATNVFVSFETEAAQRQVLSAFSIGAWNTKRNNVSKVNKNHLFRGSLVLDVTEADEPSTIRWQDLNETLKDRLKQLAITTFVTFCAIALCAFLVTLCRDHSVLFGAIAISIFNAVFPVFAKILTNMESHSSEGKKQTSLYVKIAGFRWVNTAIVITIITPFTATLLSGKEMLLNGVYAIFFAEIVTTNAIQLLDPMGHIKRHFLAPRAQTQEGMNIQMQGTIYELAERYTNMTKILFLALWYCSIYPMSLFLCALATFINYFSDRFSLMRTWKPAPRLGTRISRISRKYFFTTAVIAMVIVGSYQWAGFPYDNLCDDGVIDIFDDSSYKGTHTIFTADPDNSAVVQNFTVTVDLGDEAFRYCLQDLLRMPNVAAFPALPKYQPEGDEWMSDEQEQLTRVYGMTSLAVLCLVAFAIFIGCLFAIRDLFRGTYDPTGDDQQINFSDVPSICSYIPEVHSATFSYPLLAADIDNIGDELFEWEDPDKPYAFYDLTRDAEELLRGTTITKDDSRIVFSRVMHWPPEEKEN